MSIVRALFVPNAVVDKGTYWTGAAILILIGVAVNGLPLTLLSSEPEFSEIMMIGMLGWINFLLVYPWFCLIAGRLRDAGASVWFYLAGLVGYVVLNQVLATIFIVPSMVGNMEEFYSAMPGDGGSAEDMEAMMALQAKIMRQMLPMQILSSAIASVLTALPFGLLSKKPGIETNF